MNYQEDIAKAASMKDEAMKREWVRKIQKQYHQPFRRVFRDVVNASHKQRSFTRKQSGFSRKKGSGKDE